MYWEALLIPAVAGVVGLVGMIAWCAFVSSGGEKIGKKLYLAGLARNDKQVMDIGRGLTKEEKEPIDAE